MWDETGFSGSEYEDDPGVKNVPEGVASVVTGATEALASCNIGDFIKLRINPSNRINKDAIGAYTTSGLKIGYVPFKSNQIDLKAKYTVAKINLTQDNPLLLIAIEFNQTNFITII